MSEKVEDPSPSFRARAFQCPHCSRFAKQNWGQVAQTFLEEGRTHYSSFSVYDENFYFSRCDACEEVMVWKQGEAVWPLISLAPEAHSDFPTEIKPDYEEARQIYNASPRASAALLRLCLQKLCKHLGASGNNINSDIQYLYDEYGLGRQVRDSMDILRVIGNNAVHPGEIDLQDNREISLGLFRIINFIIDKAISEPAHIDSIFSQLPESARDAIARREARAAEGTTRPILEKPSQ